MPTKAALVEEATKRMIVTLSVGMPTLRALSRSPPMAKIQLP